MALPSARTRALLRPAATDIAGLRIPHAAVEAWTGPLLAYGALAAVAIGTALARGQSPLEAEPWLPLPLGALGRHGLSAVAGSALAGVTIRATRHLVRTREWARALHTDLRPAVRHSGTASLLVLGAASAASEELFFRGLLATTFGVVASSLAFGLLHQTRGRVRWVWAGWATIMGFLFGALFLATGSLVGPLLAHAVINVANLRFIRDTDLEPPKRARLGGLLRRG